MKKIIHLSDPHLGYEGLGERFAEIVTRLVRGFDPAEYLILISGDLVEDATKSENYIQMDGYITSLRQSGFSVLLCPGNHDYGHGWLAFERYVGLFKETFLEDSALKYPKLDVLDGIAFIALDSMAEEVHWHDALLAQGELGRAQLGRLEQMLKTPEVLGAEYRVVYLHHHPFDTEFWHGLKDANNLRRVIEGKIDALLFGHKHEGGAWYHHWSIPRIYDAGTCTGKGGKRHLHRVIDLSKSAEFDYDAQLLGQEWRDE